MLATCLPDGSAPPVLLDPIHSVSPHMIDPSGEIIATALCWIFSRTALSASNHGDQATDANSRCGLTYCTYNLFKKCRFLYCSGRPQSPQNQVPVIISLLRLYRTVYSGFYVCLQAQQKDPVARKMRLRRRRGDAGRIILLLQFFLQFIPLQKQIFLIQCCFGCGLEWCDIYIDPGP